MREPVLRTSGGGGGRSVRDPVLRTSDGGGEVGGCG